MSGHHTSSMKARIDSMETILDLLAFFPSRGERTAIVYRSGIRRRSCSYALLHDLSLRMNGLLQRKGIHPGDRVLLWAPNGLTWVVAFFGCIARGAIVVPVDFMSGEERAAAVADQFGGEAGHRQPRKGCKPPGG